MPVYKKSLEEHRKRKGKIEVVPKMPIRSVDDLNIAYTPGVAAVSREIAKNPGSVFDYTIKSNTVAIVSDGSAVLGLGNVGPEAALPVMEGKALLMKELAGVDGFPIVLNTQEPKEIIETVKRIAPGFGAINLEDIAAPKAFEVEGALQEIGIPVFHDDQHGTAIVVLAALTNALKVVRKNLHSANVVISGAGAAGIAICRLLCCRGVENGACTSVKNINLVDSRGALYRSRAHLNRFKSELFQEAICCNYGEGKLEDVISGADVFIGVSKGGIVTPEMVSTMAENPIVFAMANPEPEIMPELAKKGGAAVVGTGRGDFPNQINNALAFPGVFRGALDAGARVINNQMKMAAVHAISSAVENPTEDKILPEVLDRSVAMRVAEAVKEKARETGVSRK